TREGEFRAATLPAFWQDGLVPALQSLWAAVPQLETWDVLSGWRAGTNLPGNPFPSAYLLALLLLGRPGADAWVRPEAVEGWLLEHHPYWTGESVRPSQQQSWIRPFLLGLAYPLRLLQAARATSGDWLVRLSGLGRGLLGLAELPQQDISYPQTLLVQPNL